MKHCSYCGAEYPDDVTECAIDHQPVIGQHVTPTPDKPKHKRDGYEIRPLTDHDKSKNWVTILSPHSNFEADIVFGRLRAAGIRVRFHDSVTGAWTAKETMRFIQVRVEDHDAARGLLNAA